MYLFFVVLNSYLRSFFFLIDTNNIWHWRLPLQGLLNELVAAGLFYLIFRILFSIITISKIRKVLLVLFVTTWIIINYINYQYANTFNSLLPFSWFYELKNITEIGSSGDILAHPDESKSRNDLLLDSYLMIPLLHVRKRQLLYY